MILWHRKANCRRSFALHAGTVCLGEREGQPFLGPAAFLLGQLLSRSSFLFWLPAGDESLEYFNLKFSPEGAACVCRVCMGVGATGPLACCLASHLDERKVLGWQSVPQPLHGEAAQGEL